LPQINIQGTVIDFPNSAASPNWAEAVDQFVKAVEQALASVVGPYDVAPQALTIDSFNPGTNIPIAALSFPVSAVRSATIRYAVYRTTTTDIAGESGEISIFYNANGPISNKWEISQRILSGIIGAGKISFNITDVGQIQFSTTALAGSNHVGKLTFVAQSILKS